MDQIHIEISELKKLLSGCVKIDTWISQSCYMDLSKLIHGCLKVVTVVKVSTYVLCISCTWPKKNQAEV